MADRLTQLQDAVNQMAEHFTNSIGCLQQTAQPSSFPQFEKTSKTPPNQSQEDYCALFAQLIARSARDIDYLIEHLPNDESSVDLQMGTIERLEEENIVASRHLEEVVRNGENLLGQIQSALSDISQTQLQLQETQNQEYETIHQSVVAPQQGGAT